MKKIIRFLASVISLLAVFISGAVTGIYYQNEIYVVIQQYSDDTKNSPLATPTPVDLTKDSVINLPSLSEPLPLVFSDTLEESIIQEHLKDGAVVLPLGTTFGEPGNVVVTAHSSGTKAFGPYRFAFSKLSELEEGSEYSISTPSGKYHYRVYGKEIVWPNEVDRLPDDERSTVTLVTCWPLWTNFKRLLVHAELISVDYNI